MLHRPLSRVELMARWFDDDTRALAAFLGVSPNTVRNWMHGTAEPTRAAARLLSVMERLEGTELHEALVDQARAAVARPKPAPRPRGKRTREPLKRGW